MKMEDSSDDDGNLNFVSNRRGLSFDFLLLDNHDEQLKLLASPVKEKEKENKTPPKNAAVGKATESSVRRKGKKTVSRAYKDEDGYLGKI